MGIDEMLAQARSALRRVAPQDLPALQDQGAFVIDIRAEGTRSVEGHIPGSIVIDRLALEWRLDDTSGHAIENGPCREDLVIVVCNEGYASSLAARDLQRLGFAQATDLIGGFRAYADTGLPIADLPARTARYPLETRVRHLD